jgi:hypothetical protein
MQKKINAIEEIPGSFHTKQFKVDLEDHIPLHFLFCYQKNVLNYMDLEGDIRRSH